jgi:hypothetical protein
MIKIYFADFQARPDKSIRIFCLGKNKTEALKGLKQIASNEGMNPDWFKSKDIKRKA